MIKAVLFDLDGTLLDRDASLQNFIVDQHERLFDNLGHISNKAYLNRFIDLDDRGYVWKDKVYRQLCDEFSITTIDWECLLQDYVDHFKNSCIPFSNLTKVLNSLEMNSLHLGMITNGKGQFQMDNIEALGIAHHFQTILISEWEGIKKPDSRIFNKALKQLNVAPEEAIFVGDHLENDVIAAQNVGMIGILKSNNCSLNVNADYVIDDLSELLQIICELNQKEHQLR